MRAILLILMASILIVAGCAQPQTKAGKGAAWGTGIGAAAGAGLGQAIGGDTKSTLIGAGIGALVGGLAGYQIGSYMDAQEAAFRQELATVEGASIRRDADTLALTFKSDVLFDVDSALLKPGAHDELFRVAKVLNQYPQTTLLVAGHTDSTGSEEYNQRLSERRAEVVKNALVGNGVNPERIRTIGYGESRPIASNASESGRQLNRRVEIRIEPIRR
ncbi:outer membrane protein OmpA-like peptidoglycan-associated protein [Geothermobacter ehrlichii]|uniref:Outer membrane protein OmpA-like peptidoglycan-associated protein n=1 Tax=Geothermobacter ehrlichii TaxID=213224 RepID=A0A5D3WNA7_9BACT|nr:OmpA family protein [Geothermobacter ehrlichii]TYO99080.1 outer membrane protein OmpA-like peptidoglycan-associated protein [Geothermobacter ehrlichii]